MTREQHVRTLEMQRATLAHELAMLKARRERADGALRVRYRAQIETLMRRDRQLCRRLAELSQQARGARAALRSTWRGSIDRLHEAVAHWIDHVDACNP